MQSHGKASKHQLLYNSVPYTERHRVHTDFCPSAWIAKKNSNRGIKKHAQKSTNLLTTNGQHGNKQLALYWFYGSQSNSTEVGKVNEICKGNNELYRNMFLCKHKKPDEHLQPIAYCEIFAWIMSNTALLPLPFPPFSLLSQLLSIQVNRRTVFSNGSI